MQTVWQQLNGELARIAERVRRGIVQVRNQHYGAGTGIVVHSSGLIVTNAHVIHRRYPHITLADGRTLRGHLVGYDREEDLSALQVEVDHLDALSFGNSVAVRPGDLVQGIGHPWGIVGATSAGVVVDTEARWLNPRLAGQDWLVADFHLGPGNSGGPLVDSTGQVLGINTMLLGIGLGVAIPAHRVRAFLRRVVPAFEAAGSSSVRETRV